MASRTSSKFAAEPENFVVYTYGALLAAAIIALIEISSRWIAGGTFPWALASLLGVALAAVLWGTRSAIVVLILCGLFTEIIGPLFSIGVFAEPYSLSMRVVRSLLYLLCGAIIVTFSHLLLQVRRRAEQQQSIVQAFQAMMLPQRIPPLAGYSVACSYRPAMRDEAVGGDFYDLYPIESGARYVVAIGDIAGKGTQAATSIALIRYAIRAYALMGMAPGDILARTNDMLIEDYHTSHTATAFVGILTVDTGTLAYATAGHELPIVLEPGGSPRLLWGEGLLLGVQPRQRYRNYYDTLAIGEALVLVTDGVTEARNRGGEFLGTEGAVKLLHDNRAAMRARDVVDRVTTRLEAYTNGEQRDDIAIVVLVRRRPLRRRRGRAATRSSSRAKGAGAR